MAKSKICVECSKEAIANGLCMQCYQRTRREQIEKNGAMPRTRPTEAENKFLDGLGMWNPDLPRNRLKLLKKYFKASKNRVDWAGIDKDAVIKRV